MNKIKTLQLADTFINQYAQAIEVPTRFEGVLCVYGKTQNDTTLTREAAESMREQAIGKTIVYENEYYGKHQFRITEARIEGNEQFGQVIIVGERIEHDQS